MKIRLLLFIIYLFSSAQTLTAQNLPDWRARVKISDSGFVDFLQYFQIWNVVTLQPLEKETKPRVDTYLRRARFGLAGQLNSKLQFYVGFTYDGIGKDSLTVSAGIPNPDDNQTFSIRDAFFTYRHNKYLNLTIGYFRPRAGKESIYTSAFNITQEKGQPSFHPRIHMVGRAIGRESGINVGGFFKKKNHSFLYDFGVFDPNHPLIKGDNTVWSPLITARGVWMIGQPEIETYQMVYSQSGFMERKGLSIGANMTYQKRTSLFRNNMVYGLDAQLNFGPLDLLGEYLWLYRETANTNAFKSTNDNSYVVKGAWNFRLPRSQIFQLSLMNTATRPDKQFRDNAVNILTRASLHSEWAGGFNWLVKRNRLKLGLHFVSGERFYYDKSGTGKVGNFKYVNPSIQWMM